LTKDREILAHKLFLQRFPEIRELICSEEEGMWTFKSNIKYSAIMSLLKYIYSDNEVFINKKSISLINMFFGEKAEHQISPVLARLLTIARGLDAHQLPDSTLVNDLFQWLDVGTCS
jgi:hypothetical protein